MQYVPGDPCSLDDNLEASSYMAEIERKKGSNVSIKDGGGGERQKEREREREREREGRLM